jgi:ketosteroid isomerase-like protein
MAVSKGIIAADNSGDIGAVSDLYEDDAAWLPPSGLVVEGKAMLLARYKTSFDQLKLNYSEQSVETQIGCDWARFSAQTARGGEEGSLRGPMKSEERFLTSFEMTGKGDTKKKRWSAPFGPAEPSGMQKTQMTEGGGEAWRREVPPLRVSKSADAPVGMTARVEACAMGRKCHCGWSRRRVQDARSANDGSGVADGSLEAASG